MTFIELLLAAKGGSKSAFEELFGRYKNLLRKKRKVSTAVEVWRLFSAMPNANSQYDAQKTMCRSAEKHKRMWAFKDILNFYKF